jgi:phosphoribosylformylglycinamidine synthase
MNYRIEVANHDKWRDSRGESVKKQILNFLKLPVDKVRTRDVYTICADITTAQAEKIAAELSNPVLQKGIAGETRKPGCDWLIVVGFRPGVTDNVGHSAHEAIGDIIGRKLRDDEFVFSSIEYLIYGKKLKRTDAETVAKKILANELIETVKIFNRRQVEKTRLPLNTPFVSESGEVQIKEINLEVSDSALLDISKKGILALTLDEMKVIQNYFRKAKGRAKAGLKNRPTDAELEILAQTWSEHCKHKIFDAEIEYVDENGKTSHIVSCFKSFIKKSTEEISKDVNWLVSVFHDNAGVIAFNDKLDLVYKVETHNSPSALDPYGGAMTGIVGVNRDPMGTGMGANLLINAWGYCLGSPFSQEKDIPEGLHHPRRLRDGIHKGVIDGGNQSGIPYGLGWEYFEERYLGKPLVYCGTVGTLPKTIGGAPGHKKKIHGATFSSKNFTKTARHRRSRSGIR